MRTASQVAALCLPALWLGSACSGSGSGKCGSGVICGAVDAGTDAGSAFTISSVPTKGTGAGEPFAVDLAADGRIGIAYFWDKSETDRELDYLELETDGSTKSAYIDTTQRVEGLGMAFDSAGVPSVSYLGQDPAVPPPVQDGGIVFWLQANLAIATVQAFADGGVWHNYAAHKSADITLPGDPGFATYGSVVGLFSTMVHTDAGFVVPYRDVHGGQFATTDYGKSNWDAAVGVPTATGWSGVLERIQIGTDTALDPHGGMGALAKAAIGPSGIGAICSNEGNINAAPGDVFFALRADGGWIEQQLVETVNNVGPAGASIAGDPVVGFGIAWVEMEPGGNATGSAILSYTTSKDGKSWANPEQVYGSGSGGWEPSIAFDSNDLPNIAYYVCSQEAGASNCPAGEQGLWLATRLGGTGTSVNWSQQLVDPAGGHFPNLHFDSSGSMVLIYRDAATGGLKLARPSPP